jgi:ankyrin repeat protein
MAQILKLIDAVNANDMRSVRYLIEVANVPVDQGSCLAIAASRKKVEIVSYLLHHGANANKLDSFGTSALHYCARTNNIVNTKELLQAGATPNARDKAGVTPLHLCSLYGWPEIVSLLLKANATPHQSTILGVYPMDLCVDSLLRRTKGLFDKKTDLNEMKNYLFQERHMIRNGIRDKEILKMAQRSDIKRLQRVLYMLVDARKNVQITDAASLNINERSL